MGKKKPQTFAQLIKQKKLLKVKDVAAQTGWTPQHIRRLCRQRKLTHRRLGVDYYFEQADVDRLFTYVPAVTAR